MQTNQVRDDEIEIDLKELFFVLLHKAGIILLAGLVLALAAVIGTKLFLTPQYDSVTKMYVLSQQNSTTITSSDLSASTYLTKDYAELIKSRTVLEDVIATLELEMNYKTLSEKVGVSTTTDTRIITITVTDPDPYVARDIADAVRTAAAERIKSVMNIEAVNVVDVANVPESPSSPNMKKNVLLAALLGMFGAAALVVLLHLMNDTIRVSDDVEKYLGASVLGTIPLDDHLVNKKKKVIRGGKRR